MRIRYRFDETDIGTVMETKECESSDIIYLDHEKVEDVPNITIKSDDEEEFVFIIDNPDTDAVLDSLLRFGYADLSAYEMYYNPGLRCKDDILKAVARLRENHR